MQRASGKERKEEVRVTGLKCASRGWRLISALRAVRALRLISAESERERKKGRSQGDWTKMCIKGLEVNKCIEQ